MEYLPYALAGLAGGALAIYLRRRPADDRLPKSTMAVVEMVLRKRSESALVGSIEEAHYQLKPSEALAIVRLAKWLDGDRAIIDAIRMGNAMAIREMQSADGFFERFSYERLDGGGPPFREPAPGTWRHDHQFYDMARMVEILELFQELEVEVMDKPGLVSWIQAAQTMEGRFDTESRYNRMFSERHPVEEVGEEIEYHHPQITGARPYGEIEETALAVLALRLLGTEPGDKEACISWLSGHQNSDGAYSGPSHPDQWAIKRAGLDPAGLSGAELSKYIPISDLDDTFWAVKASEALGTKPRYEDACRNWLKDALLSPSYRKGQTQYPIHEQFLLQWDRVEALTLLGGEVPYREEWVEYARSLWTGGIASPGGEVSDVSLSHILDTYRWLSYLKLMDGWSEAFLAMLK